MMALPFDQRRHFDQCMECGEWFDRREVDQIFEHLAHALPPTLILLQTCPACSNSMHFHKQARDGFVGVWFCYNCGAQKWAKTAPLRLPREEYLHRLDEFAGEWFSLDG